MLFIENTKNSASKRSNSSYLSKSFELSADSCMNDSRYKPWESKRCPEYGGKESGFLFGWCFAHCSIGRDPASVNIFDAMKQKIINS